MKEVRANLYATQLKALRNYLDFYFGKDIDFPEINRPKKNIMSRHRSSTPKLFGKFVSIMMTKKDLVLLIMFEK